MSKLELWEYLYENKGWHSSTDLRERFNVKQQLTLRKWTAYPFILNSGANLKRYKFNTDAVEEYKKAIGEEVYVPPIKLRNGREVEAGIPEPDNFTMVFPFPKSQIGKVAEAEMLNIANLGPEWNWAKQAVLGIDGMKLYSGSPSPKKVVESLITILSAISAYNTVKFEGVEAVKESLTPPVGEMNIEDIRQAELNDILKHVPSRTDEIDYEAFFNE